MIKKGDYLDIRECNYPVSIIEIEECNGSFAIGIRFDGGQSQSRLHYIDNEGDLLLLRSKINNLLRRKQRRLKRKLREEKEGK